MVFSSQVAGWVFGCRRTAPNSIQSHHMWCHVLVTWLTYTITPDVRSRPSENCDNGGPGDYPGWRISAQNLRHAARFRGRDGYPAYDGGRLWPPRRPGPHIRRDRARGSGRPGRQTWERKPLNDLHGIGRYRGGPRREPVGLWMPAGNHPLRDRRMHRLQIWRSAPTGSLFPSRFQVTRMSQLIRAGRAGKPNIGISRNEHRTR